MPYSQGMKYLSMQMIITALLILFGSTWGANGIMKTNPTTLTKIGQTFFDYLKNNEINCQKDVVDCDYL
jgi:hypothetical protein